MYFLLFLQAIRWRRKRYIRFWNWCTENFLDCSEQQ